MSIKEKELEVILFDWVRDHSIDGCFPSLRESHIVWAEQSEFQPKAPFVVLKIIAGPNEAGNGDDLRFDEAQQHFYTDGMRSITLNIQIFGPDAYDIISKLHASLQNPAVQEYFQSQGISCYDASGIIDLTELLDQKFEKRKSMDVFFYVPCNYPTSIEVIETVEVSQGG
ncbi:MAG: hypothetical protein ISQ13_00560 [Candidatus Margulisbacteria bacterium]|jgi:hypothetical protein|nr:hypothetical protein [Candidatus Margulisiibacteriota bacterium]